jgi:hypothetical protein
MLAAGVLETLNLISEQSFSPFFEDGTRENDHSVAALASAEEICQQKKTAQPRSGKRENDMRRHGKQS